MKSTFRNACFALSRYLSLSPGPRSHTPSFFHTLPSITTSRPLSLFASHPQNESFRSFSSSMAGGDLHLPDSSPSLSLEKQFEEFRTQLDESGSLREKIRAVVLEIESTTRLMHASLLLVHQSGPLPGNSKLPFYPEFGSFTVSSLPLLFFF